MVLEGVAVSYERGNPVKPLNSKMALRPGGAKRDPIEVVGFEVYAMVYV